MSKRTYAKEQTICGQTFYTLWGMCEHVEGRSVGTHITPNTLLKYVQEGCPCFEHSGALFFNKDLTDFRNWLIQRKPARQLKALEKRAHLNRW